jgi:hypothetical protein
VGDAAGKGAGAATEATAEQRNQSTKPARHRVSAEEENLEDIGGMRVNQPINSVQGGGHRALW